MKEAVQKQREKLELCDEMIRLCPQAATPWWEKGHTLFALRKYGQLREAEELTVGQGEKREANSGLEKEGLPKKKR
ncbi:MAG TPA: hypothetical protein VGV92_06915 [Gammaproteobacteria bacterium]|nr:hypothetical protein [Gammaproteobacteria bacterium]